MKLTQSKALFLDRDGIINIDHGYVGHYDNVEYVDGIFELIRRFEDAGYRPVIVTNQSGIARGLFSEDDFLTLMRRIQQDFTQHGIGKVAVYYCPHHPTYGTGKYKQVCTCRKPAPGMLFKAADDLSLSLTKSIIVGDSWRDIEAGQAANLAHCYYVSSKPVPKDACLSEVTQVVSLNDIHPSPGT